MMIEEKKIQDALGTGETGEDLVAVARDAHRAEQALAALIAALRPFVEAYRRDECPVGDSDLYDEQPRSVHVTLGDCRRARSVMARHGR